ncbi:MAG TPA: extracellular solute-binding protein [Bacilli bacterium]
MRKPFRRMIFPLLILAVIGALFGLWRNSNQLASITTVHIPQIASAGAQSGLSENDIWTKLEPSFLEYYEDLKSKGIQDSTSVDMVIKGSAYAQRSAFGMKEMKVLENEAGVFIAATNEDSWLTYEADIPVDGFYQMGIRYYALEGKRSSVLRSFQIDGAYPFFQAKRLEFQRMWEEAGKTTFDKQGNEYNPSQKEKFGWQYRELRDPEAKVSEAFRFYLTKGRHQIRINTIREPMVIGELRVYSPIKLPSYEQKLEEYKENNYLPATNQLIKIQAESAIIKSDPTLRRGEDREPATEPYNRYATALNVVGRGTWHRGGQWIEWEFEMPESGLYHIGARFGAWWLHGFPIERIVTIDGEIPFQEMNNAKFPYHASHQSGPFGNKDYLFYLEKGKHRIRMEVQIGSLGEVFDIVQNVSRNMSVLSREIIMVTGTTPDVNRVWDLSSHVPNLEARLYAMVKELQNSLNKLYALGIWEGSQQTSTLELAGYQMLSMAEDTDTIPSRLTQFRDTASSLGLWITSLNKQDMELDYLVVKSPDVEWPKPGAGYFKKLLYSASDFALSFVKDYRGIGDVSTEERTIHVWVSRGRDWAEIIKRLADEDFTAKTGIKINVNTIPAGNSGLLMLGATSGKSPDVAIGVESTVPFDFAVRNALVNLGDFPDYPDVAARFRPGALIPYKYRDGHYALPETQNFNMLFYRTDIMEELGIRNIPETWDDVLHLIPQLQQKGMDFYYPHVITAASNAASEFSPFLFQHGGEFYKQNERESALDSPEALKALKLWTALFKDYKIPVEANFYNRFRTGEMPIGVADYSTYLLLSTAAPELNGWWEMKPMPGVRQESGEINRSTGGAAQTGIIFKNSKLQKESWEFLKWWTSADIQEEFGIELESLLGVEARWNTANVEALKRLPWPQRDIESITEQWDWFKERQIVPGSYFTDRYMVNVWNEVVLQNTNERESLDDAVKLINKELLKKRIEFGIE